MQEPFLDHARNQLERPVNRVLSLLPLAARNTVPEVEVIHQLRVNCRRSETAIKVFLPMLDRRAADLALAELKLIRRSVGAARDWDVLMGYLLAQQGRLTVVERPCLDYLVGYCLGNRASATSLIQQSLSDTIGKHLRAVEETLRIPKKLQSTRSGKFALDRTLIAYHAVREALSPTTPTPEELHGARKRFKMLRYSLEIFRSIADPAQFRSLKQEISSMQDFLGQHHDAYVADIRIGEALNDLKNSDPSQWRRVSAGGNAVIANCRAISDQTRAQILERRDFWLAEGPIQNLCLALLPSG